MYLMLSSRKAVGQHMCPPALNGIHQSWTRLGARIMLVATRSRRFRQIVVQLIVGLGRDARGESLSAHERIRGHRFAHGRPDPWDVRYSVRT
jgi:hypothetical protein